MGLLTVLGVVLVVAAVLGHPTGTSRTDRPTSIPAAVQTTGASGPVDGQSAAVALGALTVQDAPAVPGYDRDLFGYRAVDLDHNGCDTRNDILRRDLTDIVLKPGTNGCVVLTGTLADPYTGRTLAFERGATTSADVQIDHVVSLSDAWSAGAWGWDETRRQQLGNDPLNLLAVDGAANSQKSDRTAATWLPRTDEQCAYVARQIAVKDRYGLTVGTAERDAMAAVLATCPNQPLPADATLPPVPVAP